MACCYRQSSVVCLCVCLVCWSRLWALQKWTDQDAVWSVDLGWPKELCVRWVGQILQGKGNFWCSPSHWKALWVTAAVYTAKTNNGVSATAAWLAGVTLTFPRWKICSCNAACHQNSLTICFYLLLAEIFFISWTIWLLAFNTYHSCQSLFLHTILKAIFSNKPMKCFFKINEAQWSFLYFHFLLHLSHKGCIGCSYSWSEFKRCIISFYPGRRPWKCKTGKCGTIKQGWKMWAMKMRNMENMESQDCINSWQCTWFAATC